MDGTVKIVFGMIGGLALFLFGMNSMSEALQKAAGERMKRILSLLTKNPVMGAVAGAVVTAVLQSSSATTVMVIGFVSAGLMPLAQAISVIFGANIGTTMTAQLIAFKLSAYIYPIIFAGFVLNFLSRDARVRSIGMVIFSFGLLFEGIETMGSVMKPLAKSPLFTDLMARVAHAPPLGVLLGAGMTMIVQSSSATIAVLQNFASQSGADGVSSVIGLTGAIPILLGDNIGTTITALLASIGQSKNAKRTAVAHSVFNLTGSAVFLLLIPVLAAFVRRISPKGNEVAVISRQIANAHTTFNVACTLVWLPLIPVMVKIVCAIVRGDDIKQHTASEPRYLDNNVLSQSTAALYLASNECARLFAAAKGMVSSLTRFMIDDNSEVKDAHRRRREAVKSLQGAISSYITRIFEHGSLTEVQAEEAARLLFVSNNIDRLADRCADIDSALDGIRLTGRRLSDKAKNELSECADILHTLYDAAGSIIESGNGEEMRALSRTRSKMRKAQKKSAKAHLDRVEKKKCNGALTQSYTNILYNLDRMADNCVSIAEEGAGHSIYVKLED